MEGKKGKIGIYVAALGMKISLPSQGTASPVPHCPHMLISFFFCLNKDVTEQHVHLDQINRKVASLLFFFFFLGVAWKEATCQFNETYSSHFDRPRYC